MQCTSEYPVAPERAGLNLISEFRERYNCPIGLSDHSGTIHPSLAAVALGAAYIEAHVVFDRTLDDLESIKAAGKGMPVGDYGKVLGKRLRRKLAKWDFLRNEDLC